LRNFAHLFSVSLVPFSTALMARTRLSGVPLAAEAGAFVLVNVTYMGLLWETFQRSDERELTACATHDATAIVLDLGSLYFRDVAFDQISLVWLGTGLLLPGLLSTARTFSQYR
jgi:uncharacterized membrane protein